jgi:predicted lipoprotein with Yx(FWY)xxD motif
MRSRKLVAVLFSASLAMGLAACGDDDEPVVAGGGAQTGPSTTAPANTGVGGATTTTVAVRATVTTANSPLGTILVDSAGKTLYTWDRDTGETSTCTGGCATTWPPLFLPAGTTAPVAGQGVTGLSAAARPDDATRMQVVWNGKPLYYYAADTAPGETKGDGVGGTWHVAKPA